MFKAPDTNPDVKPTALAHASGTWSSIGALLGLIADLIPVLQPVVPEPWRPALPVIGAVVGLILNRFFQSSYRPK